MRLRVTAAAGIRVALRIGAGDTAGVGRGVVRELRRQGAHKPVGLETHNNHTLRSRDRPTAPCRRCRSTSLHSSPPLPRSGSGLLHCLRDDAPTTLSHRSAGSHFQGPALAGNGKGARCNKPGVRAASASVGVGSDVCNHQDQLPCKLSGSCNPMKCGAAWPRTGSGVGSYGYTP